MEALIASTSFFLPISNSSSHIRFFPSSSSPNINFGTFRKTYTSLSSSHLVFSSSAISAPPSSTAPTRNTYWMVLLDKPPQWVSSKSDIVDYYVRILAKVLYKWVTFFFLLPFFIYFVIQLFAYFAYVVCSEKDAQMSIYDASFNTHFGFCCHIDEDASRQLASELYYMLA